MKGRPNAARVIMTNLYLLRGIRAELVRQGFEPEKNMPKGSFLLAYAEAVDARHSQLEGWTSREYEKFVEDNVAVVMVLFRNKWLRAPNLHEWNEMLDQLFVEVAA